MFTYKKIKLFYSSTYFLNFALYDLISGLHMQIQTWHSPLRLCIHAKYYVKSGLTNVLKNANKTKNMHLFSIRIANYITCLLIFSKLTFSKHSLRNITECQTQFGSPLGSCCKVGIVSNRFQILGQLCKCIQVF